MFHTCNTDPDHVPWVVGGGVGLVKQKHSYEGGFGFLTFPSKYEMLCTNQAGIALFCLQIYQAHLTQDRLALTPT